jgi:flagellar hook-associated protein 2
MSSSSSPITFSGSSTFSSDFQSVLNRAVSLASLPIQALQTDVSTLQSKQSALASLESTLIGLQAAIGGVSAAASGTPTVSTGGSSALSATATSAALNGTYTIQVDAIGAATTTLSKAGLTTVTDPSATNLSPSTSYTLTVNGMPQTITASGTTLNDLVSAINLAGNGVQATVVNVGSNTAPDYRLAITSNNLAPDTIQLNDGSNDLLDTLSTGTNTLYKVNGQAADIASSSNQVTLSTGLTVQLNQQTTSPVTITVKQTFSGLQSALSSLVSSYNSAFDALAQDRGQTGGALTGDRVIYSMTAALRGISLYNSGSGSVKTLADLGLTLDETGHMSFSASTFNAASPAAIQSFLGSTTSGGMLKAANASMQALTDSTSGLLQLESNTFQDQIMAENQHIADQQARVTSMQTALQQQLAAADAAIATLQSQNNYFQQLFTATYGNGTSTTN